MTGRISNCLLRLDIHCILFYTPYMVATSSTMLPLGTEAPNFALPDVVTGNTISLKTFADKKALLVMFICRHCKYVQHVKRELAKRNESAYFL